MIAYLAGKILVKKENYVILVVNQIGYKIFAASKFLAELSGEVELYIYHQVKEDGQALYGFKTLEELEFFELLLTVSGVGPKSALNIMSLAAVAELKNAIALGNHQLLTKVSGIGAKTAERLVVELKAKVGHLSLAAGEGGGARNDEIEALISLGYALGEAREALNLVGAE